MKNKISVVVPCFNESVNIINTYEKIIINLKKFSDNHEIVFVDDGSNDNSFKIIEDLSLKNKDIVAIKLSRNFGHQNAIFAGLENSSGDIIFVIDADLQDPPELFNEMYNKWKKGYDIVYGVRKTKKEKSILKKLLSDLYHKFFFHISDVNIAKDLADFCLLDKKIKNLLINLKENNLYFRGLRSWLGFKQTSVEYDRLERKRGLSKYSYMKLFQLALDGIFNFTTKPLTFIFLLGCIILLISLFLAIFYVTQRIYNFSFMGVMPEESKGFFTLITVNLFFGGVNLISLGIIGQYVGRIYREVKCRPKYIIEKKIKN